VHKTAGQMIRLVRLDRKTAVFCDLVPRPLHLSTREFIHAGIVGVVHEVICLL